MPKSTHEMLESAEFKQLVRGKWTIAIILTFLLFVVYYGFILLVAANKPFLAQKVGEYTTIGIPIGVGVIVAAWVLTGIYVSWANRVQDAEVSRLVDDLKK
ncbi:MAG TPA: DUF485 domain-containing protein [Thermoanaerobaculia bacterium]|jgi:uncharacterized membrane protein (DUF485 family)|nr:DUF485 domain-containing protein [Thermoanaerobaculia bacterium]